MIFTKLFLSKKEADFSGRRLIRQWELLVRQLSLSFNVAEIVEMVRWLY
jgi:hypothetical protein